MALLVTSKIKDCLTSKDGNNPRTLPDLYNLEQEKLNNNQKKATAVNFSTSGSGMWQEWFQ